MGLPITRTVLPRSGAWVGGNIYVAGASALLVPLSFDLMVITGSLLAGDASFVLDASYPLCSQS